MPHVVIVPSPGMGLLIPFLELAKQLIHLYGFHVTCIIPTLQGRQPNAMKAALASLPSSVNQIFLPPVCFDDFPDQETSSAYLLSLSVTRSFSPLRDALRKFLGAESTDYRLVALFADLFTVPAFDVAKEFNIAPYLFFSSGAVDLSFLLHLPKLDQKFSVEYRDLPEPIHLPGCIPIPGEDLEKGVQDRKSRRYKLFLDNAKMFGSAKAIVVNTFMELQPAAIKALQEKEPGKPPIYPVGPLVRSGSTNESELGSDCTLKWLDHQPGGSVLFVSFGSGGTLSHAQMNELALGLEISKQNFLWVVRTPNDQSASAAYLSSQSSDFPLDFLPEGFVERIKGRGLIVRSWAPQAQILSHGSIGGFLTHCGWNSILESVVNGVPLIAWPLFAEQRMNALQLTKEMKVAVRPEVQEDGLVGRNEVARIVRTLMEEEEGNRIRERMKELKEAAARASGEGGCSREALSELALLIGEN